MTARQVVPSPTALRQLPLLPEEDALADARRVDAVALAVLDVNLAAAVQGDGRYFIILEGNTAMPAMMSTNTPMMINA